MLRLPHERCCALRYGTELYFLTHRSGPSNHSSRTSKTAYSVYSLLSAMEIEPRSTGLLLISGAATDRFALLENILNSEKCLSSNYLPLPCHVNPLSPNSIDKSPDMKSRLLKFQVWSTWRPTLHPKSMPSIGPVQL